MDELRAIRSRIDVIDLELLRLLEERARWVKAIQDLKDGMGIPRIDLRREEEMLSELIARNAGKLPPATIRRIFQQIFRTRPDDEGTHAP